jgi:hypothetical protein
MRALRLALPTLVSGALLSGCAAVEVERDDGTVTAGIPFNVRVPATVQTTKRAQRSVVVQVKAKYKENNNDTEEDIVPSPVELVLTTEAAGAVADLQAAALGNAGFAAIKAALDKVAQVAIDQAATGEADKGSTVVANTLTVEARLSPHQYSFKPHMPLIGTLNATWKLNATDGTMSEGSVNVADKTIETALNLFPFTQFFSRAVGLTKNDKRTVATLQGRDRQPHTLVVTIKSSSVVYRLERVSDKKCNEYLPEDGSLPPLRIEDHHKGICGVQLIAKESTEAPAKPGPKKPSYGVTGEITLPDKQ